MKRLFTISTAVAALLLVSSGANAQFPGAEHFPAPPRPKVQISVNIGIPAPVYGGSIYGPPVYDRYDHYDRYDRYDRRRSYDRHRRYDRYKRYNRHDRYDRHRRSYPYRRY